VKNWIMVVLVGLGLAGCEQTQTTGDCGAEIVEDVAEDGSPFTAVPLNEQCSDHVDCASNECVPVVGAPSEDAGSCWSNEFVGCEVVNFASWVVQGFCDDRVLVVCQIEMTPQMEENCVAPSESLAPWIANFQCCDPSLL
jgi:hypothetical protein